MRDSEMLREIERRIAVEIFGWTVYQCQDVGWGLKENFYLVDEQARVTGEHTSITRLLGGNWITGRFADGHEQRFFGRLVPAYTSNIEAALEIITRINPYILRLTRLRLVPEDALWECWFESQGDAKPVQAPTIALAICLAALEVPR